MLEIYCEPCTVNSRKVLAGLELLGTEFKLHHVDFFAEEHKGAAYLAINPNGTVPSAIVDGDGDGTITITQSNAILQYAADHTHAGDAPAYPRDIKRRAAVNQWLLWESSRWFPSCYVFLEENVFNDQPDQAAVDREEKTWRRLAGVLEQQLARTRFVAGDQITIADIALAAPMPVWKMQRLPLDQYPNVLRWMQSVEELPCWKKTQKAVDEAYEIEPSV